MQFEDRPVAKAEGWHLAHSVTITEPEKRKLSKGAMLDADGISCLVAGGIERVTVFRLEPSDVGENDAATQLARSVCGANIQLGDALHGRCNLFASSKGLLIAPAPIKALNHTDEALTLATLPHLAKVEAGQLVATAKIIPYGVQEGALRDAVGLDAELSVAPFRPFSAGIVFSGAALNEKTLAVLENRLTDLGGRISQRAACHHSVTVLAAELNRMKNTGVDLVLVLGVSAISDRRDVVPAALEAAGGSVQSLGMPVDPGNLLMLGALDGTTVLGLPGCARSPALNGLDWVLERLAAGLTVTRADIADMGVGGLLKETGHRAQPRAPRPATTTASIQPIVLAAGRSTRAGAANKLLSLIGKTPVIQKTLAMLASAKTNVPILVTGHDSANVILAAGALPFRHLHNCDFSSGMASSLRVGLRADVPERALFLVCLGDMPFVQPATVEALSKSAARLSEAKIFIPTFNGKRGHPVLWHRDMLTKLSAVEGDKGGRDIIHKHENLVQEVPVDDPGILIDLDTPEALAQFGVTPTQQ